MEKAKRGLEREFADKARLFIPGHRSRKALAEEAVQSIPVVRSVVGLNGYGQDAVAVVAIFSGVLPSTIRS